MIVRANGAEIHYTTRSPGRGRGPACLVLSAIGTGPYEAQMPARLSDHLQLVFVDLRGGGQSTGEPADLSFDRLAEDLEAVRRDLGADRVAVLGHSLLGMLAIEYGRRCPASVSHVIVVGTPPHGDIAAVAAAADAFFEQDASEDRRRALRDHLAALPAGASMREALLAQTPRRFYDFRFDAARLLEGGVLRPRLMEHLFGTLGPGWDVLAGQGPLAVPLLLAHGRYDYVVPHTLWNGVAEQLPAATLRIFEQSGHQPFFEEPDAFTEVVMGWMEEL